MREQRRNLRNGWPCRMVCAIAAAVCAVGECAAQDWSPSGGAEVLRVEVAESFLNRLLSERQVDERPVRRIVAGAMVVGQQRTTTDVRFDCQPCRDRGLVWVVGTGETRTDTVGLVDVARVRTLGHYRFEMRKPVLFDGRELATARPHGSVQPWTWNVAAGSQLDGVPVLGPLAGQIVYERAERMRPLSEWDSSRQLANDLLSEFNSRVDAQLGAGNKWLRKQRKRSQLRLSHRVSTTDTLLRYGLSLGDGAPAANQPPRPEAAFRGCRLAVHESLFNRILEELPLAGREVDPAKLNDLTSDLPPLLNLKLPEAADEAGGNQGVSLAVMILEDERPVSIHCNAGDLVVVVRARFRPAVGEEIPTHEIRIAMTPRVTQDEFRLQPNGVEVTRVDGDQGIQAQLVRQIIQQQFAAQVPEVRLPRTVEVPVREGTADLPAVRLASIRSRDGWLVAAWE